MSKEPSMIIAAIVALIGALFTMMGTFGVAVSKEQQESVQEFVTVAAPFVILVVGWIIRSKVVSPNSAGKAVGIATNTAPGSNVIPEITGVSGFKDAAADAAGINPDDVNWKPPIEAH